MSLQQELFNNLVVASSATIYSQPVDLGSNSNVFAAITVVTGTTAVASATVEGSTDVSNWATLGSFPAFSSAPFFNSLTLTGVGARYVRVKLVAGAGAVCANASLSASNG